VRSAIRRTTAGSRPSSSGQSRASLGAVGTFDPRNITALNGILAAVARAEADRVTAVDLHSLVCPRGTFTNTLHGIENARPDGTHFSPRAADWVATWLGPQLLGEYRRGLRDGTIAADH
jgi:hypothetical protein